MLFAIPRPNIVKPTMTPEIGPGNTRIAKFPVAAIAFMACRVPPATRRADTRMDFCFHDKMNAAADSMMPMTGKIKPLPAVGNTPFDVPKANIRNEVAAATASP